MIEHITYNPGQCGGRPCIRGMGEYAAAEADHPILVAGQAMLQQGDRLIEVR